MVGVRSVGWNVVDTSFGFAQALLELGEGVFDRIEVGAVSRQKPKAAAARFGPGAHGLVFVDTQVFWDHGLTRAQRRAEHLVQIGEKYAGVG